MQPLFALALLEVMDKEPGIADFWIAAAVLGTFGYLMARRRWWWAVPVLLVLAACFLGTWSEWTDPFVGPAIAQEAGSWYPYHLIASNSLAAAATIAGVVRSRRRG